MIYLLDTNILLRLGEPAHPHHAAAIQSLRTLATAGHTFAISSQTIAEFLAVATRPIPDRGLGMDQATADRELSKVTAALTVFYDSKEVMDELRRLVVAHAVTGKSVHDCHLVATMNVYRVRDILTFNVRDFTRYPGITIHDPTTLPVPASEGGGR